MVEYVRKPRQKRCIFCGHKVEHIDYKDVDLLRRFLSERNKIRPRRVTGNCAQHQRKVAIAVKRAREVALIPYSQSGVQRKPPRH